MTDIASDDTSYGAYGLTITGFRTDPASIGLVPVPPGEVWPPLEIRTSVGVSGRPTEHALEEHHAVILLIDGEYAEVDRRRARATIHTTKPVDERDLVHPYLASPAGVIAQWNGRVAVHAGGAVVDGGAWVLLGDKESGKTTTLLELHRRGYAVVADDMIVVGRGATFAGPRCLDVRPDTAERLGDGTGTAVVRDGTRTRVALPPVPPQVPLRGWIVLREADAVAVRPVPIENRLPSLRSQLMMGARAADAGLELLAAPMWELRRPRSWSALGGSVDALLEVVTQTGERAR